MFHRAVRKKYENYREVLLRFLHAGIFGLLLVLLTDGSAFTQNQPRRPRKVVEPINLVYDSTIEGVDAAVQEAYIYSSDGLYIAAVVLRPPGAGPFPAVIVVHGAPGGRGMSELKQQVQTRGMVVERFVKEGYIALYCDYRKLRKPGKDRPQNIPYPADIVSVIRYTKNLPEVDAEKVCLYSGSLGSETSILALGEEPVAAAVLNAPPGWTYMKVSQELRRGDKKYPGDMLPEDMMDRETAIRNLGKINNPVLLVVGTEDRLLPSVNKANAILNELGKDSSVDIYPGMRHGFYFGPRKIDGNYEQPDPAFLKALDKAVAFFGAGIN